MTALPTFFVILIFLFVFLKQIKDNCPSKWKLPKFSFVLYVYNLTMVIYYLSPKIDNCLRTENIFQQWLYVANLRRELIGCILCLLRTKFRGLWFLFHPSALAESVPSLGEFGWRCGPHKEGEEVTWAPTPQKIRSDRACSLEACTICRLRVEEIYSSHRCSSEPCKWTEWDVLVQTEK